MESRIGNRYIVRKSIGEGGMADVYLAYDAILKREVAIKVLRGELNEDPINLQRFQREASAITNLSHPNIVEVYDVGEEDGNHYIVMEYIEGKTLKQLLKKRESLTLSRLFLLIYITFIGFLVKILSISSILSSINKAL